MHRESRDLPDRRKAFKKLGTWLLAGGGTLTVAYFAMGREGPIDEWVAIAPVKDLPVGEIQGRLVTVTARGNWFNQRVERGVWLLRNSDDSVTVLSSVCPHKSYNIRWRAEIGKFECPGHKSAFDSNGAVLAGPSPRAMDALEHKVENGMLMVRYRKFKSNVPTKEVFA